MSRTRVLTAVAVAALLAPAAGASWNSFGTYEPDTTLDIPSLMRDAPPGAATNRVYFNVYTRSGDGVLPSANGELVNPNVGALKTNIDPVNNVYFEAVFGVWIDCNQDGYVGMAETAIREYDARLLLDDSICPAVTGKRTEWTPGAHNYNGWVSELIPIGNSRTTIGDDNRVYKDDEAMVWGDPGKPDDAVGDPGVQCQARARGDSRTTGGLLHQLDCQGHGLGVGVSVGAVGFSTGVRIPIVRTFNDADALLGTGLGFGNDPETSTSPINQPTFGDDGSEHTAVRLQDCSAEPDPTFNTGGGLPGNDFDNVQLLRPIPSNPVNGDPSSWTVPGTLNYTAESIYTRNGTFGEGLARSGSADCDFNNDAGQDFYGFIEGNVDVPPYNGKDAAWKNFVFRTGSRGTLPATFYPAGGVGTSQGGGRAGVATDLGVEALGASCTASSCVQTMWAAPPRTSFTSPILETRYDINENDPAQSTASAAVAKAPYFSFYAYSGKATADRGLLTPGGSGVYGSAQCGDNVSGMHNGWNCDRDAWYRRVDGSYPPLPPGVGVLARVGDPYNHRDVECFDGSLGGTGVGTSPAYYGEHACARPVPS